MLTVKPHIGLLLQYIYYRDMRQYRGNFFYISLLYCCSLPPPQASLALSPEESAALPAVRLWLAGLPRHRTGRRAGRQAGRNCFKAKDGVGKAEEALKKRLKKETP